MREPLEAQNRWNGRVRPLLVGCLFLALTACSPASRYDERAEVIGSIARSDFQCSLEDYNDGPFFGVKSDLAYEMTICEDTSDGAESYTPEVVLVTFSLDADRDRFEAEVARRACTQAHQPFTGIRGSAWLAVPWGGTNFENEQADHIQAVTDGVTFIDTC